VLAVFGLAGCGDDDSPFAETGPTKLRLISEADAICRSYESRFVGALQGLVGADDADRAAIAERLATVAEDQLAELRELPQPEEDRELLAEVFASVVDDLVDLRRNPAVLDEPDALFSQSSELATEYGFQDCGDLSLE
jgi:hypothetical protein